MHPLRLLLAAFTCTVALAQAPPAELARRLEPLDAYMAQVLKDFNCPGLGVAVVSGDQLLFAKGYGFRDYGRKLPFTPATLFQIASNTNNTYRFVMENGQVKVLEITRPSGVYTLLRK